MGVLQFQSNLFLASEITITAGATFPVGQPPYKTQNYETTEGLLFVEGDGGYGDVEIHFRKTELGVVEKVVRLDGQKGITPIRAGIDNLRYFEIFNASAGTRTPKIYKYTEDKN